ncbi:MAG: nitronate monooxygenase [bacterium]
MKLPELVVKNFRLRNCIFQGGMGIGVSLAPLAEAVAREGGGGIISSAGLSDIVSLRDGKSVNTYEAVRIEIEKAKSMSDGGAICINIMCAIINDYEATVKAAIDEGAAAIISGGGLPLGLPGICPSRDTALIPIVSSARALEAVVKRWERDHYQPDAAVLEGPLAGGHLGFKFGEINDPAFQLEKLLPSVLEVADKHGGFPIIVAGGVYTHDDIIQFLAMGASGVQMGTRFLVTEESSATKEYKDAVIAAGKDDITVVSYPDSIPSSPCGLPFRILTTSPAYEKAKYRIPKCTRGYVLRPGHICRAMSNKYLCVCEELLSSAGYAEKLPLYTVGTNAALVDRVISVHELMHELCSE